MRSAKHNFFLYVFTLSPTIGTRNQRIEIYIAFFRMPTSSSRLSNRLRSINNQSFVTLNQRNMVIKSKIGISNRSLYPIFSVYWRFQMYQLPFIFKGIHIFEFSKHLGLRFNYIIKYSKWFPFDWSKSPENNQKYHFQKVQTNGWPTILLPDINWMIWSEFLQLKR